MEDIISHGRRPPGGWRRRVVLAVVLAGLVALGVAEHVGHGGHGGAGRRGHPTAAGHVHGSHRHHAPAGSVVIAGPLQPWAAAARIPRTGIQPAWFSPASGTVRPIGGLPEYGFGYVFTRVEGGWVLQPAPARPATCGDCSKPTSSTQAGCDSCPGPPAAVYYLPDRAQAATTIGVATMVAPATASGSAWLTTFPATSGLGTAAGIAREYDSTGKARGPAVTLPAGYKIIQATREGLLLAVVTSARSPGNDLLWNPASRKVTRTFADVIAATPSELAYTSRCAARCPLRVLNLVSGQHITLSVTRGAPVAGEFSPDARYLAIEVRSRGGPPPGPHIELATLATRQLTPVSGPSASGYALASFGWPGNHDYLATALTIGTSVQVTYWNAVTSTTAITYIPASLNPKNLITGQKA